MDDVDLMKPSNLFKLGPQVVENLRKVREGIILIGSFRNVDLLDLVNEHELTNGESLLGSVDFLLSGSPYNVLPHRVDVIPHYDVSTTTNMANAVALFKLVTDWALTTIFFLLLSLSPGE